MIKTYKFKLKPNLTQEKTFQEWVDVCRLVYNLTLEQKQYAWQTRQHSVSRYESYNQLPELKQDFVFVKQVHSDVLQQAVDRVYLAYDSFFKGGGYPKFKGKRFYKSFTFKRGVKAQDNFIKLPKIGRVKFFKSRNIPGTVKTATITKHLKGWFITLTVDVPNTINTKRCDSQTSVGIDVGVKQFLALSTGEFIQSPFFLEPRLERLRELQQKLSRQVKGSNSRNKTKHQIAKLHLKISNSRTDFNHKVSTQLSRRFDQIYVEDLRIQQMTKLNSTLSRRLLDLGFYNLRMMLEYKMKSQSKTFLAVPPYYTSQCCSSCGHTSKSNRLSQSDFVCTSCSYTENSDLNAAKNIQALGKSLST